VEMMTSDEFKFQLTRDYGQIESKSYSLGQNWKRT